MDSGLCFRILFLYIKPKERDYLRRAVEANRFHGEAVMKEKVRFSK